MNWKDTVLKSADFDWELPTIRYIEDGKNDLILTIPFTAMLEAQAKVSFAKAIGDFFAFIGTLPNDPQKAAEVYSAKLTEWGIAPTKGEE